MPDVLLAEENPAGDLEALVERDSDAFFMYLYGKLETDFGVRSVWVQNVGPAPAKLDVGAMKDGRAPINPAEFCVKPDGAGELNRDSLRFEWLPEGNSVALFVDDRILAIIPPWSGHDGFHGYSIEALGMGPMAWALEPENALRERFRQARDYWTRWEQGGAWRQLQTALMKVIESRLGGYANYYAIDSGKWPPKALLRIPVDEGAALVTIGLSCRPQPHTDDVPDHRRIELGVLLPEEWTDAEVLHFAEYLGAQSGMPWSRYTWFGDGHTIPCDAWKRETWSGAALVRTHPKLGRLDLGRHFGDPVSVLWLLPLSSDELAAARASGTADVLANVPPDRWQQA